MDLLFVVLFLHRVLGTAPVIASSDGHAAPIIGGSGKFRYWYIVQYLGDGLRSQDLFNMCTTTKRPLNKHYRP